jgi:hypothetical protein
MVVPVAFVVLEVLASAVWSSGWGWLQPLWMFGFVIVGGVDVVKGVRRLFGQGSLGVRVLGAVAVLVGLIWLWCCLWELLAGRSPVTSLLG